MRRIVYAKYSSPRVLQNNLHPSVLRRLFTYLEEHAVKTGSKVFLTTHSSVALDLFGSSRAAQIIHVTHDGVSARTTAVSAHFDRLEILSGLGARPSDLLQSNGILWLEGPSDRLYLNRWIELLGKGEFRGGRDYQCAFYGGSLLARLEFVPDDAAMDDFANMLRVNPNVVVVCDGDRTAETGAGSQLKERVERVVKQVSAMPTGYAWITAAKEIENYVPGVTWGAALNLPGVPDPLQFEHFFPSEAAGPGNSFLERELRRKSCDKVEFARRTVSQMTAESLGSRFDLVQEVTQIVARIRRWNVSS